MFQVFHLSLQVLYLNISKVDRGVAYVMRVGSGRGHERSPCAVGQHGSAAGAVARKSDSVGALAHSLREHRPMLASRIGRPNVSKY